MKNIENEIDGNLDDGFGLRSMLLIATLITGVLLSTFYLDVKSRYGSLENFYKSLNINKQSVVQNIQKINEAPSWFYH